MKLLSKTDIIGPAKRGGPVDPFRLNLYYRLPVILLCGFIFLQSCFSFSYTPPLFEHEDKVKHFLAYGVLAFLAARWIMQGKIKLTLLKIQVLAFAFTVLYGLSDEFHQSFVPGRYASGLDLVADAVGALFGAWIFGWLRRKLNP